MLFIDLKCNSLKPLHRTESKWACLLAEKWWSIDMNPKDPSLNHKSAIALAGGVSKSGLTDGEPGNNRDEKYSKDYSDHWKVLLGEFIHLLGLFWIHSQTAKAARASEVLFHQLLQHLDILGKMPKHDGGILVRRVHRQPEEINSGPDYLVLFGRVMINSKEEATSAASKQLSSLKRALKLAFECFAEQDIHSLYLRLPGRSTEKVEQFRFSLHILTRYFLAAKDGTSIAFRYYGRSLTIPLISGADGRSDPNLTVMAALNGLSTVNARELIRQAQAYHKMYMAEYADVANPLMRVSYYNQIFKVRSMRSQIIRPLVEINNLARPDNVREFDSGPFSHSDPTGQVGAAAVADRTEFEKPTNISKPIEEPPFDSRPPIDRQELAGYVNSEEPLIGEALNALFADDYATLELPSLGGRFASVSRLLYAIDKQCQDPTGTERIIELLRARLKGVSDKVLANIITQRQGLKIVSAGRTVLVGLVHPRLFDLITLIKEHVVAQQQMVIIKEIAFHVDPCHINLMADGFGISVSDAHHIFGLLRGCFGAHGSFIRPTFESRIDAMARHENVLFEIFWCFLKQTPRRKDRLNFLNAIQLLMARLNDPRRALRFLMADICQHPLRVEYTDRNAFALANVLLHKENKELYIDVNRTPEDVLRILRPLNEQVRQYAIWRLEVDQGRYRSKLRTIADCVQQVLMAGDATERKSFELSFLLALEREALIFSALAKGYTARMVLREALERYGDPNALFYQRESTRQHLSELVLHLQIVARALGRAGNHEDIDRLKSLERNAMLFTDLDAHPAHGLRVKQMLRWVPEAIKMIQSNNSRP